MTVQVWPVEDNYVVSEFDCWVPGLFDSPEAARLMATLPVDDQYDLWKEWGSFKGVPVPAISLEDMNVWVQNRTFSTAKNA